MDEFDDDDSVGQDEQGIYYDMGYVNLVDTRQERRSNENVQSRIELNHYRPNYRFGIDVRGCSVVNDK